MLYKFYSESCAPCKAMSNYLILKYPNLVVSEIDVSDPGNEQIVDAYNVNSIPTLIDTETGKTLTGFQPQKLDQFLSSLF
jgi:thiol-disulfide isomerase/thioredoxin